jgi:hypothetical protein
MREETKQEAIEPVSASTRRRRRDKIGKELKDRWLHEGGCPCEPIHEGYYSYKNSPEASERLAGRKSSIPHETGPYGSEESPTSPHDGVWHCNIPIGLGTREGVSKKQEKKIVRQAGARTDETP